MTFTIVEIKYHPVSKIYNDWVLDNKLHYVSCKNLSNTETVEMVIEKEEAVIEQIKEIPYRLSNV